MKVHIGCRLVYTCSQPTPMLLILHPSYTDNQQVMGSRRKITPLTPIEEYIDTYGNEVWRMVAPTGRVQIDHNILMEMPATPDFVFPNLPKTAIEDLPFDVLNYTLPSRLCLSDLLLYDAWDLFGHVEGGWKQVQAVCDWIHQHITYVPDGTSSTTALDTYQQRHGVCRDFAHLGIAFCRALNFPARYVYGYLPDIGVPFGSGPMDFHAWFEVYIDGLWCTFDARHNIPRIGRVVVARGRDAIDVAFATMYGNSQMLNMKVWAEQVDEHTNFDSIMLQLAKDET